MKKKLLCLGDSNTYGYDPRSCLGGCYPAAWPEILAKLTDALIRRQLPADLLILLLGTNDMLNARSRADRLTETHTDSYLFHLKAVFPDLPLLLLTPMKYRTDGSWPKTWPAS